MKGKSIYTLTVVLCAHSFLLSEGQLLGHEAPVLHLPPYPWLVPHDLVAIAGISVGGGLKPGATGQEVVSRAGTAIPFWLIPGARSTGQCSWSFPPSTPSLLVPLAVLDSHGDLFGDDGRMVVLLDWMRLLVLLVSRAQNIKKMLLVPG